MLLMNCHEFKDISATFCFRDSSIPFEAFHEKLMVHESYIKRSDSSSSNTIITAKIAHKAT